MTYVDGFVLPVRKDRIEDYKKMVEMEKNPKAKAFMKKELAKMEKQRDLFMEHAEKLKLSDFSWIDPFKMALNKGNDDVTTLAARTKI